MDPANWYPMPAFAELLIDEQIMLTLAYIKTLWNEEQLTPQQGATLAEAERSPLMIQPGG